MTFFFTRFKLKVYLCKLIPHYWYIFKFPFSHKIILLHSSNQKHTRGRRMWAEENIKHRYFNIALNYRRWLNEGMWRREFDRWMKRGKEMHVLQGSGSTSQDAEHEKGVSISLSFLLFMLFISLSSFFHLVPSQIWYSSQRSPSNNLPGVPVTWKSITVIRCSCQANRNEGLRACVCVWEGARRGSMMPEVEEKRHQTKRRRAKWLDGGGGVWDKAGRWGSLPGGGNLSNCFSLTARTLSCLSTWQTDTVRFSPTY